MDAHEARRLLLTERAEAVGRLRDLGVTFDDIVEAARDSNLDDEHDPEGTTIAAERQLVSSLARSAEDQVSEIDAAPGPARRRAVRRVRPVRRPDRGRAARGPPVHAGLHRMRDMSICTHAPPGRLRQDRSRWRRQPPVETS